MSTITIALIDTRHERPGGTIGTVISTHKTMLAAFKSNDVFQARIRASGVGDHIRTRIVTLKAPMATGEHVYAAHLADNADRQA